jgi:hypothetical protein
MPDTSFLNALQHLCNAVAALPESTPVAHPNGIVDRSFRIKPSGLAGNAWHRTVEAYARCFRNNSSPKTPTDNILRGQYGMDCVVAYSEDFQDLPGMDSSSLFLIEKNIGQLTDLVYKRQVITV